MKMTVLVSLSLFNLRALSSRMVDGMFLMRTSQHAGTQLVISVWNENECKHYKLFQDKVGGEKGGACFVPVGGTSQLAYSTVFFNTVHLAFPCTNHSVKLLSLHACSLCSGMGFP